MNPNTNFTYDELVAISAALEDCIEMFKSTLENPQAFQEHLTSSEKRSLKRQLLNAQSALSKINSLLDSD